MPSVVIKEVDRTGAEVVGFDDFTVLIPGSAANGVEEGAKFLLKTSSKLKEEIGKGEDLDESHVSYHMAKRLLDLGMRVLFVVKSSLSAGSNFFDEFEDKVNYDLRFITAGEFETDLELANEVIKCASRRGDAIALINVPESGDESADLIESAEDIIAWLDSLSNEPFAVGDAEETPLKYGAAFAGHFTIDSEKIKVGGSATAKKAVYPAFFDYLSCFASNVRSYADWYAMAGSVRGRSPFGAITVLDGKFGDAEIALLQTRDLDDQDKGHSSCNVIAEIRPYGNIVWGNRTLHPITLDPDTMEAGLRASNFLNVRQLCSDVKKTVYRACKKFTFEPNTDTLWVRFCNEIIPLLEKMKADQGIRGYKLVQEATAKKATLKAIIRIIPIEAVEDFDITVELADSIEIAE